MRHKSFKGFFLPRGLKIKWLHIDIAAPPPPPRPPTLQEIEMQRRAQRAEERFQRRRTRGDNIGDGGQRQDGRVEDDSDDEADRDTLPGYKADVTAPVYMEEWREQAVERGEVPEIDAETADAIRAAGVVPRTGEANGQTGDVAEEHIMSVAEYEARQRAGEGPVPEATERPAVAVAPAEESQSPTSAAAEAGSARPQPARVPSGVPPMYEVPLRDERN